MIIHGDCLDELKKLEDGSVDLICTDPPYGYSFMGKDWDKAVPSVEIWQECLRVLKPGAFCFVMSAPRSDVQMHMIKNLSEAGFRLDFTPIYWTYASGFPKAGNIGKLVDKRLGKEGEYYEHPKYANRNGNGADSSFGQASGMTGKRHLYKVESDQAKALDGSYAGFQPKPAVEVIIVAMKPLSEKTFVDQALKNGKGITWLDDCRVPTDSGDVVQGGNVAVKDSMNEGWTGYSTREYERGPNPVSTQGRFPANLLVSDDVLNDGVERKSNSGKAFNRGAKYGYEGGWKPEETEGYYGDSGSYSRYFDLDKWASTLPFLIVPKASKSEKNKGLDNFEEKQAVKNFMVGADPDFVNSDGSKRTRNDILMKNHHPTVKPLKLMSYLITLGSRAGDVVLDPFCGSGTTCLAAKQLGREYIGIEREKEYVEIAEARVNIEMQGVLL